MTKAVPKVFKVVLRSKALVELDKVSLGKPAVDIGRAAAGQGGGGHLVQAVEERLPVRIMGLVG